MADNEPRLNYSQPVEFPFGTTPQQQSIDHRLQQQNPELQLHQVLLPKTVVLRRQDGHGFGFTLRHFIVYPPESCNDTNGLGPQQANPTALTIAQPMDTVFVKEVRIQGPAHLAGLRTGDRLLAVNGMPVAGTPYARVVTAIQQTPATLTLQVVPKECDILQTFFSETAHNPETNQRQHKLHSQMLVAANIEQPSTSSAGQSHGKHGSNDFRQIQHHQIHHNILHQQQQQQQQPHQRLLPPQQFNTNIEPFYSNLKNDRIDSSDNTSDRIYAEPYSSFEHRNVKAEPQAPMQAKRRGDDLMQLFTRENHNQQNVCRNSNENNRSILTFDSHFAHLNSDAFNDRRESSSSISSSIESYGSGSTLTSDLGDSAIMTRLRKSFEQKEEFLRRPSQPTGYKSDNLATNESTVRQREFYARPNRLQKSIWPPQEMPNKNMHSLNMRQNENRLVESDSESIPSSTTNQEYYTESKSPPPMMIINQNDVAMPLQQKSYNIMNSQQAAKTAAAVKLAKHIAREQFYNGLQQHQQQNKQINAQTAYVNEQDDIPSTIMETEENCRHIPTTGLHIVSERAKQFESGRPLSPDGQIIDRTSLYRSELSRLSTKRPVPNVAVRRREFEMKAENTDWRKLSSDDNDSSHNYDSSDYYRDHPGVRARSLSADSACDMSLRGDRSQVHSFNEDQFANREFSNKQPYRQNSYIEAVTQTGAKHSEAPVKDKILLLKQDGPLNSNILNEIKFQNKSNQLGGIVFKGNDDNKDIEMKQVVDIIRKGSSTLNGSSIQPTPPIRPTTLNLSEPNQVVRRHKAVEDDDERPMRRVSYLRATSNDTAFEIDSDMDQSPLSQLPDTPDNDAVHSLKSAHRPWRRPRFTSDIQPLRRIFEEAPPSVTLPPICEPGKNLPSPTTSHGSKSKALSYFRDAPADSSTPLLKEGELNIKITFIDGKRSNDRSWKTVCAEIRGNKLKLTLHREGKSSQSPEPSGIIDLRSFHVTDANYTKRKYVFKLTSATNHSTNIPSSCGTEILIQTENQHEMKVWMDQLCVACRQNEEPIVIMRKDYLHNLGSQQAEPQRIAGTTIIESSDDITGSNKNNRRLSLGTRSPSGQSPVIKNRKSLNQLTNVTVPHSAFHQREEIGSPKSKTWSSVVRSIRRSIQGPVPIQTLPEGASVGAQLIYCPPSEENQYVPYLVARCINIVESRGLNVVGIYRIPGNIAAITALTELVNRGFDEQTLKDPKWEDVNVVSSLLKLFIRRLPDGLLPNEMYQHFIDADKQTARVRLLEIKALLKKLPPHSYETLKILIKHLNRVSHNCDINLMDPRNIAIVFGPSIVRSATDTLETAVKDMKHQCRIVEALVLYYSFFFGNDPVPQVTETPEPSHDRVPEGPHTDLLLNNVAKIEPLMKRRSRSQSLFAIPNQKLIQKQRYPNIKALERESSFVANIVQAANRKIRQRAQRKSTTSATPDTVSLDSSTSAESKEHLKRFGSEESTSNSQNRNIGLGESQKRLSEDDINDSAFADNGSMSLNTVTTLLDNKLRSLRNKSPSTNQTTTDRELDEHNNKPLSLGENIPYADESPERPIRSKPIRTYTNRNDILPSQSSTPPNSPESSQENISKTIDGNDKIKSPSITSSSCDDTDVSSTSTPPPPPPLTLPSCSSSSSKQSNNLSPSEDGNETVTVSNQQPSPSQSTSMRIDTEVLREMNQILSDLEKFKTKLNRSLSLNYKNHHKDEYCCCNSLNHHHHRNNNNNNNHNSNNNNSLSSNNNTTSSSNINNNTNIGLSVRTQNNQNQNPQQQNRLSLTKDEKTDKNISKKRQLQDVKYSRRYHTNGSRSIKRRHTVGGTHDYSNKIVNCYASNGATTTITSNGSSSNADGSGVENENAGQTIFRASSTELVTLKKKELKSPQQEQENTCHY